MAKVFRQTQLEAIADALGDTVTGLTGSEIGQLIAESRLPDPTPGITKRHRLYNAFAEYQNSSQERVNILAFIRKAMRPERYARAPERFEPMRALLNRALAFAGLAVDEDGTLRRAEVAQTLSEAERRAREPRADLEVRGVHADVVRFCREELVADNYFHVVLEAVKSVADKLRERTGLTDDGAPLVDRVLGGDRPILAINPPGNESDWSERKGFAHLIKGVFGMFRNTTAHAPKIIWAVEKRDAEEVLTILSLIHRRIDTAHMPPRV